MLEKRLYNLQVFTIIQKDLEVWEVIEGVGIIERSRVEGEGQVLGLDESLALVKSREWHVTR